MEEVRLGHLQWPFTKQQIDERFGKDLLAYRVCFMYLFMGALWGHFSSSNSFGILDQGLDIHICVDEISF